MSEYQIHAFVHSALLQCTVVYANASYANASSSFHTLFPDVLVSEAQPSAPSDRLVSAPIVLYTGGRYGAWGPFRRPGSTVARATLTQSAQKTSPQITDVPPEQGLKEKKKITE